MKQEQVDLVFDEFLEVAGKPGDAIAHFHQGRNVHYAKRTESMLNAANGMPTEEAVKYITHGPEMVEELKSCCVAIEGEWGCNACSPDNITPQGAECCTIAELILKLEAK